MLVPALVAGIVALLPIFVHLVGDTMEAFGHGPSGRGWWLDTWFIVLQFFLGTLALALAAVAALRNPTRLGAVVMAVAGGVFLQGVLVLYYRVVVTHLGYGIPF